jgi:tetratricopeptide (TPR) repeat protein
VPGYRRDLAVGNINLGLLLAQTGRFKDAEDTYRDAVVIYERLAADFPSVPDYHNELAATLVNFADLLHDRKELPRARELLGQALPHHEEALKANPRNSSYRETFRENRNILAATLIDLADHAGAAATAAQVLHAGVDPAKDAYTAATLLARCVPLAEKDSKLSEAKREELSRAYADQAVAALQSAIRNGYKNGVHMKKDKDLDPLRSREDFKKQVADLEKQKPREQPK